MLIGTCIEVSISFFFSSTPPLPFLGRRVYCFSVCQSIQLVSHLYTFQWWDSDSRIYIEINHSPFDRCANDTLDSRTRENSSSSNNSIANERKRKRGREKKSLTFERRKHGSFVECSLLEMNWYTHTYIYFLSFSAI